jgi:hypothetical protein
MSKYDNLPDWQKQDIQKSLASNGNFPKDLKEVTKSLEKDAGKSNGR